MKWFFFTILFSTSVFAQASLFDTIYGPMVTGCIRTAVTTSGHNRSVALTIGKRYMLFGEDGASTMNGATIRCIQGGAAVDVTSMGGSKIGVTIFTQQQIMIQVTSVNNQYVSCISAAASQQYDLCALP